MQGAVIVGEEDHLDAHEEVRPTPITNMQARQSSKSRPHESASSCTRASTSVTRIAEADGLEWLGGISQVIAKKMVMSVQLTTGNPRLSKTYQSFLADPPFDPSSFAVRFVRRAHVSPSVVLVGYYYLHRIIKRHPKLKITSVNATRLVTIACTSAAKFLDDQAMRYNNRHWVFIVGNWVSLRQFNQMEIEFLTLLDFDLSINLPAFHSFCKRAGVRFRDLAR
eukprot:TRINITY_DN82208_c0_g1_i1.p1 TRINITY_DN82208_c0_g1~~TRINITY_DN82208_c0_g1_i1.p1  ORF type:complete len:223 (-),score=38.78 TRINITY_DN82208_c0_g1_i1:310-978(-)